MDERYLTKTARVFCDTGNGFDGENCCISSYVSRDDRSFRCRFDLSSWPEAQKYRFDPCEHGGKIRIDSVAANISRVCVQPMNAAGHENEYDIFDTIDPIYSIDVPKGQSLEWIEITGEIVEERDDLIFQHKQNQLEKVAEETKILRDTLAVRQQELEQYRDYQTTLQQTLKEREKEIAEYRNFQQVLQDTVHEREQVIEQYKSYQGQLEQTVKEYEKQQHAQNEIIQQHQINLHQQEEKLKEQQKKISQQEEIIKQEKAGWQQKYQILERKLQQQEEQYRMLEMEKEGQRKKIDEMTHSVSWKVTRPFRKLRRMVDSKRNHNLK